MLRIAILLILLLVLQVKVFKFQPSEISCCDDAIVCLIVSAVYDDDQGMKSCEVGQISPVHCASFIFYHLVIEQLRSSNLCKL